MIEARTETCDRVSVMRAVGGIPLQARGNGIDRDTPAAGDVVAGHGLKVDIRDP